MEILEKLKSEYAKKALIYYFDRLFELGVGFVQTWIIGRKLGADGYGIFVTYMSITGIALIFFRAGFVSSAKYIIAHTDTEKARELIGASFVVALATGFLFGVFIFIFGLFADSIFNVKVGKLLLFSSPLLVGSILRNYISSWGEATGKIIPMSIFLFITKFFEFILIFLFFFVFKSKNLFLLVLSVIAPVWFTGLSFFFFLKPSFNLLKENILTLLRVNKEFGFRVYIGQVADLTTYRLDKVFLAYFGIAKTVGNYSLADSGMRVVVDFPASIASALFRGFAKSRIINPKVIRAVLLWLFLALSVVYILAPKVVEFLFKDEFVDAVQYVYPLGIAAFFQGLYQPFNAFLFSKGCGNALRTISFTEACFNIVGNIIFIKLYGAMGACFVSAGVKFVDFLLYIFFYRRYIIGKLKVASWQGSSVPI